MLLSCKTCNGNVSSNADECPHCGECFFKRDVYCDLCKGSGEYTEKFYTEEGEESAIYETLTIKCPQCLGKKIMKDGYTRLKDKRRMFPYQYLIRAERKGKKKGTTFITCTRCHGTGITKTIQRDINSVPVNGNNHFRKTVHTESYSSSTCIVCLGSGLGLRPEPKKGCFITRAVCTFQNKSDDCYELEILRKFRDEYLRKKFPNEIIEYYETAPKVVDLINESSQKKKIYTDIWNKINTCIYFIENEEYEMAFEIYGTMFLKLKIDLAYLKENNENN